jgi:hypothetical protein
MQPTHLRKHLFRFSGANSVDGAAYSYSAGPRVLVRQPIKPGILTGKIARRGPHVLAGVTRGVTVQRLGAMSLNRRLALGCIQPIDCDAVMLS